MGLTNNLGKLSNVITSTGSAVGVNCTPNAQFEVLGSTGGALTDGIRVSRNTLQSSQYGVINYTSGILNLTGVNTSGGGEIRFNTSDGTTTTERMRISSTGNVGIGLTNPSFPLEVSSTSTTLLARFTSNQVNAAIRIVNSNASGGRTYSIGSGASGSGAGNNFYIYDETNGALRFAIDNSGNVGIGTSAPERALDIRGGSAAASHRLQLYNNYSNVYMQLYTGGDGQTGLFSNSFMTFNTGSSVTEAMRITNNSYGTLLAIGTSSPTNGGSAASWITINGTTAGSYSGGLAFAYNSAAKVYQFWDNNSFYVQNGANGVILARDASSWSSASDKRLKDITGSIDNAVSSLSTLSTIKHTYKSDINKTEHLGLIAQEIQEVFPQVVDKYTIKDDETKTEYLSVRYTELVPVLVAAIQELEARLAKLENA